MYKNKQVIKCYVISSKSKQKDQVIGTENTLEVEWNLQQHSNGHWSDCQMTSGKAVQTLHSSTYWHIL